MNTFNLTSESIPHAFPGKCDGPKHKFVLYKRCGTKHVPRHKIPENNVRDEIHFRKSEFDPHITALHIQLCIPGRSINLFFFAVYVFLQHQNKDISIRTLTLSCYDREREKGESEREGEKYRERKEARGGAETIPRKYSKAAYVLYSKAAYVLSQTRLF